MLHSAALAGDATIYVDPQLAVATTQTYDPAARKASGGAERAFKSLAQAAATAGPGQTVILRAGTYAEALAPKQSGAAGHPLVFRAQPGEDAVITGEGLSPAVDLSGKSYIVLEGLKVVKVRRWLLALKTHHCTLKGNTFAQALDAGGSSKTGLFFEEATHNKLLGNTIDDSTQDNVSLIKSDYNLLEGNVITKAKHVLWTIKGGNYNVLRGNYFHNAIQKIGEVYDCDGVGSEHQFKETNCTKHNLIEGNVFAHTASSGDHSPYCGIQYAGQEGLVRRNVFYDCIGPALDLTLYGGEARFNVNNRIAHNVFYRNHYCGVSLSGRGGGGEYTFEGNELKNNVLCQNVFVRNDKRWEWFKELDGKPVQVLCGGTNGFLLERNLFFNAAPGEKYLLTQGGRDRKDNPAPLSLGEWQSAKGELVKGCVEADPQFEDGERRNFRLKAGSPALDAGAWLTRAKGAGQGTELPVADARWFADGYGIEGLSGDLIQLEGQAQPVRVTKVDYAKHVLTLETPVAWADGAGVAYAYAGKGPDLGAFELGLKETLAAPAAPAGLEK
ncbi:MAG: right-handed parallel beta-helix repeat-containing protein [Planctomycetota bacterium]|nr:right-handed parallel beta-helix repeat-containing protein [Planctomycetota bacterium]